MAEDPPPRGCGSARPWERGFKVSWVSEDRGGMAAWRRRRRRRRKRPHEQGAITASVVVGPAGRGCGTDIGGCDSADTAGVAQLRREMQRGLIAERRSSDWTAGQNMRHWLIFRCRVCVSAAVSLSSLASHLYSNCGSDIQISTSFKLKITRLHFHIFVHSNANRSAPVNAEFLAV